jgi:hypothetical protein
MTIDEKLALLHGNGMANNPIWTMPLTHLTNGGAGYVEGVKRLGIPPLVISDAAYGIRDSGRLRDQNPWRDLLRTSSLFPNRIRFSYSAASLGELSAEVSRFIEILTNKRVFHC